MYKIEMSNPSVYNSRYLRQSPSSNDFLLQEQFFKVNAVLHHSFSFSKLESSGN